MKCYKLWFSEIRHTTVCYYSDYSGFGWIYYLDLNGEVNMEAEDFTETSLTTNKTERCHNTIERILNFTTVKSSNLT